MADIQGNQTPIRQPHRLRLNRGYLGYEEVNSALTLVESCEMVHSFLIHSLLPGTCRVFYSVTFCGDSKPNGQVDDRSDRKEKLLAIAQRVQSEYSFKRVTQRGELYDELSTASAGYGLNMEGGAFRSLRGEPFENEKVILWLGRDNTGFALISDVHENRMLAENTLRLLCKFLQPRIKNMSQGTEPTLLVDHIASMVNRLLPNGQLLFLNQRIIRQFEKEMETLLQT